MIVKIKCTHCNEEIELEIAPPKKRKKTELSDEVKQMRSENMKRIRKNRNFFIKYPETTNI